MNPQNPAKITKGYATGLIAAICIFVAALLIAGWGLIGLYMGEEPVSSTVSTMTAPALVAISLLLLAWVMWLQTVSLIKGAKPAWSLAIVVAGAAYLVWSFGGLIAGLSIQETWLSPFALVMAVLWPLGLFLFWLLLWRKLYSGKGTPKWPWEDREEEERRGP